MWQECEFEPAQEDGTPSKQSTPGRRSRYKSRPGSRAVESKTKPVKRSKSANTSQLDTTSSTEPDDAKNRVIKSAIDKQKSIIDTQRIKLKEQQKQIDELRKLKDQLDTGRAITNKVTLYYTLYLQ